MTRPRILITRPMPEAAMKRAHELFEVESRASNALPKQSELRASLTLYDGILATLGDHFTAHTFADFHTPRCKIIANFGVGYNHIDTEAARAAGICVSNTPGAVTEATADIALTLMLMSARRAAEGERLVRAGGWEGWHPTQMLGMHMSGKRLGIVGMGRIGEAVARRAHFGFGMRVAYTTRSPKQLAFPATAVPDLITLAGQTDILVITVPGGTQTHHLINANVLNALPAHAHVINVSRGNVIDENALIAVLEAGRIGGAGLDVYENEPEVPEALRQLNNATLLPHLGTAALEVREAMANMALDNLQHHFEGHPAPNRVN